MCGSEDQCEVEVIRLGGQSSSSAKEPSQAPPVQVLDICTTTPNPSPLKGLGNMFNNFVNPLAPVHIVQYSFGIPVRPSSGQRQKLHVPYCPELVSAHTAGEL